MLSGFCHAPGMINNPEENSQKNNISEIVMESFTHLCGERPTSLEAPALNANNDPPV
jgi:hypothetical protein